MSFLLIIDFFTIYILKKQAIKVTKDQRFDIKIKYLSIEKINIVKGFSKRRFNSFNSQKYCILSKFNVKKVKFNK